MNSKLFSILMILSLLLAACAAPQPASSTVEADSTFTPAPAAESVSVADSAPSPVSASPYPIVDTSQGKCYNNSAKIPCSQSFNGQDAQYSGNQASYQSNGDGTVTDLVSGLMWQQDPGPKMTYSQAAAGAASLNLGGYSDWRLPSIKELYSLILFDGTDVSACPNGTCSATPFIDTRYFNFSYGDTASGERVIDSQFATSTKYVSTTMNGDETMFGVNFADGRIKGYGLTDPRGSGEKTFYVLYVRGNPGYGQNSFIDNGDATISDKATGLTWMQSDSGIGMDWQSALNYCEGLDLGGSSDWRLPDVKELQSLVDYSRSPDTSNSAAIDPIFGVTAITNEAGQTDYPFFWSSTTHADSSGSGTYAAYVAFGKALGYMNSWLDVHGAGAQRSDPKTGSAADYPQGHGPQGDAIRVQNYVRCVTGGAAYHANGVASEIRPAMQVESTGVQQGQGQPAQGGPTGQGLQSGLPPQEAINACSASSEGAACSFSNPNGTLSGTCGTPPNSSQLACMPANRP